MRPKFAIGNVVRSTHDGGLFIVIDNDTNEMIPIGFTNCTIHPPEHDRYRKQYVFNKVTDEEDLIDVLEAYSIDKYEFVAHNIEDFFVTKIKEMVFE